MIEILHQSPDAPREPLTSEEARFEIARYMQEMKSMMALAENSDVMIKQYTNEISHVLNELARLTLEMQKGDGGVASAEYNRQLALLDPLIISQDRVRQTLEDEMTQFELLEASCEVLVARLKTLNESPRTRPQA